MTFLVLQTAAAGAGIVSSRLEDQLGDLAVFGVFHDLGRSPATAQFMSHEAHGPVYVPEELPVAGAEIIQPRLSIRGFDKSVLGAFSIAYKPDRTAAAIFRQALELLPPELLLLGRAGYAVHASLHDIAQKVSRLHKVIAGVHIPIVLHGQGRSAGLGEGADAGRRSRPGGQSHIEDLDEDPAHILLHPFIEDGYQKAAILVRFDRAVCYFIPLLKAGLIIPLHYGNELDEIGLHLVS